MRARRAVIVGLVAVLGTGEGISRAGPVEEARALAKADRPEDAERVLGERVREAPADEEAWTALGDVERQRCRLGLAEAAYRRTLERDPTDPAARAGLAEVLLLSGEPYAALVEAQAGIDGAASQGREDGRPWRMKALALVELRRYDLAVEAALRATALAPWDAKCAEALAAAQFRAGRMDLAGAAYRRAVTLDPRTEEGNLRLGNGFGPETKDKPWRDGDDVQAFRGALDAWDRGDLEDAESRFLALAERRPDDYKYRLGVGLARLSIRRHDEAWLGGDPTAIYRLLPAPEVPDVERVVPGYERLGALERHVVRVATAPARPLWAALVAAGASHEVVPLSEDLTDAERRRELKHRRTFDGRWYEHLRGVAGSQGATGAEKLREAAEFAFNTFAHEFGHQVHRHGLSQAQQAEVDALFAKATACNGCLDYYAASNADEYFAQGYEAFVSPLKRGCLTETGRHTRSELARRDPGLYAFLLSILDTSYESPSTLATLLRAAESPTLPAEPVK